jgi:nitrite reductase/ring-hydroxylating ferredoxin subunit
MLLHKHKHQCLSLAIVWTVVIVATSFFTVEAWSLIPAMTPTTVVTTRIAYRRLLQQQYHQQYQQQYQQQRHSVVVFMAEEDLDDNVIKQPSNSSGVVSRLWKMLKREEPTKPIPQSKPQQNNKENRIDPVKLVGNALGSIESNVLTIRNKLQQVRSSDIVDADEEQQRIADLRTQLKYKRKKDQEDIANRTRQAEMMARTLEESRRNAQLKASRTRQERQEKIKLLQEQSERQKRVLEAAGKTRTEFSLGITSQIPTNNTRKQRNPQSVTQQFFSQSETEPDTTPSPKANNNINISFSFPNPLFAAQRLVTTLWDSTFRAENKDMEEEWVVVFPKTRLDPGEVVPVNVGGIDLLVVASVDGKKLYCIANTCPHLGTPLETGPLVRRPVEGSTRSDNPDGCEDCIVCPLHQTAFALDSGEVRGEWCPYPPVIGAMMGAVKKKSPVAVFDIRTKGKNVEVKINSSLEDMEQKQTKAA